MSEGIEFQTQNLGNIFSIRNDDAIDFAKAVDASLVELKRKLTILADAYSKADKKAISPSLRRAHSHMFAQEMSSYSTARSGLIVTEKLLVLLSVQVKEEKLISQLEARPAVHSWAPVAFKEWKMATPRAENGPGKWWLFPVLYDFIRIPPSTIRSVIIGLEAMGFVEIRAALYRPNPKSRAKAIRLTKTGEAFLQLLAQPLTKEL